MTEPVPDEHGRIPGVDYSAQTWVIAGMAPVTSLSEAQALMDQIDNQHEEEPTS